jgi:hypothetical protein
MKIRLFCTESTKGSKSLKTLAEALTQRLGYKVWRSTKQKQMREHLKYGHSVDKLYQYNWFKEKNIPALEFTDDYSVLRKWLGEGHTIFGRMLLNSSCGKGIVVIPPDTSNDDLDSLTPCPVYTKYKKKKREFRVHVYKDKVVAVTEKRRRTGFEGQPNAMIRNLENGYVFCQTVENEPEGLRQLALQAAEVSPSDFRGVDVGFNEHFGELFVIEVNSAPGIQGSNVKAYMEAICNG